MILSQDVSINAHACVYGSGQTLMSVACNDVALLRSIWCPRVSECIVDAITRRDELRQMVVGALAVLGGWAPTIAVGEPVQLIVEGNTVDARVLRGDSGRGTVVSARCVSLWW